MMERYLCLFYTKQWLFICFRLFQSHSMLARPPAPLYSFTFTQVFVAQTWEFFLALGTRLCLFRRLFGGGPGAGTAQSLHVICMPSCVCVMCVFFTSMRALIKG